ncbi:2-hydroxyacylsphingosine 1-beta-galactosyltransferase-like [Saccoglossus kowalevskii]
MKSLNNENLYEAMVEVLSNKKYSEKAKQLSAIVKDVPMNATDTAVFWIEHVLQHGVTHLTFHEKQLSVIEYYLLDVLTVIAGTICIIFWSLRWFVVVLKRSVTNTTKYK